MAVAGLIVGLGNPGSEYAHTRHNAGYDCLTLLLQMAEEQGRVRELSGGRFRCELWQVDAEFLPGTWLCAKPLTFMNLSGQSVRPLLAWYKMTPDKLVVLHDELDLQVGELRFKFGGGNAGHNGLKSITQELGSNAFYRVRLGIGRPLHKGDVIHWVLGRPSGEEKERLLCAEQDGVKVLTLFVQDGLQAAATYARSKTVSAL